jgi:PAS domain S-box-containing protein
MELEKKISSKSNMVREADLYKRMIEEIEDYAIIILDEEGYIKNWNKGAQKIKLYSEDEILGRHFSVFYLPEDLETKLPERLLKLAKETGRVVEEG